MRYRIVIGALVWAACLPAVAVGQQQPAAATTPMAGPQREGSWELSVGVGGTYLDHQLQLLIDAGDVAKGDAANAGRAAPGGVVRLGYNLSNLWNLSAGTGVGYVSSTTVIQPFADITWTLDLNARTSPFIALGGGVTSIDWKGYRATSQYGAHLGVGLRQMLSETMALRVEAREQYEKFSTNAAQYAAYEGIGTVGFSWFLGGRKPAVAIVAVGPASVTLESIGATAPLSASPMDQHGRRLAGRAVTWTSSNDSVATVSATGLVLAGSNGAATITAASEGVTGTASVTVAQAAAALAITPTSAALTALGQTQLYTAIAEDANHNPIANPAVTWRSSDPTVASVNASGIATAAKNGTARITAETANGRAAMATITVAQAPASVAVTPANPTITAAGGTTQFAAQTMDANGNPIAGKAFTWTSDAPGVATVSATGLARAVGNGAAQISASVEGKTGSARLTVSVQALAARAPVRVDTTRAVPLPAVNAAPLVLRNVVFAPNSARLPPGAAADLDAVAAALRAIPNARWEISGHTSSMGDSTKNLRLSQRRARVVKLYLVRHGVRAASLVSVGYGSAQPLVSNATVAGRRQNMRVEIKRLR